MEGNNVRYLSTNTSGFNEVLDLISPYLTIY